MKILIALLMLFLLLAFGAKGQPLPSPAQDTSKMIKAIMPPDSIPIFSLRDIANYLIALKKLSVENYEMMTPQNVVDDLYRWMIIEWNKKYRLLPTTGRLK